MKTPPSTVTCERNSGSSLRSKISPPTKTLGTVLFRIVVPSQKGINLPSVRFVVDSAVVAKVRSDKNHPLAPVAGYSTPSRAPAATVSWSPGVVVVLSHVHDSPGNHDALPWSFTSYSCQLGGDWRVLVARKSPTIIMMMMMIIIITMV